MKIILIVVLSMWILMTSIYNINITNIANKSANKYTLIQSDSPNVPNYHPEIDLISNDTIYVNWYSNDKK